EVRPKGMTNEEYRHAQLRMMESSQESSTVVAYETAGEEITIEYNGVYVVSVRKGMPAEGKLETGDHIIGIDDQIIEEADDLIHYIDQKQAGDQISLDVKRDDETIKVEISLATFTD